jgi:hypothetical protein
MTEAMSYFQEYISECLDLSGNCGTARKVVGRASQEMKESQKE